MATNAPRNAFTLIELLVVLVIVSVLASLSLAGLAGARQRAKIDKTRSTIRKIDSVIRPIFDSYLTRRVLSSTVNSVTPTTKPALWKQLVARRRLMVEEMPDRWLDVYQTRSAVPYDSSAAARRYASVRESLASSAPTFMTKFGDAETLMMIALTSGFAPDAGEMFRSDEIGDLDGDTASEFLDGWGRPIRFIRWPAQFSSPLMDTSTPDPFDTGRVTTDWAIVPLIVSGGPDASTFGTDDDTGGFGITLASGSWLDDTGVSAPYGNVASTCSGNTMGSTTADSSYARDNITNHDLVKR
jgi:prepilin-type N-terminal cleavage/methylation domain-containing protein